MATIADFGNDIRVTGAGKEFTQDGPSKIENPNLSQLLESRAGAPTKKALPEMQEFSKKQQTALNIYQIDPKFWLPQWVRDFAEKKKSPESLVKEVIAKVEKEPHLTNLLEAQMILNELGRDPANTDAIRRNLTRKFLTTITQGRTSSK
jgi:hypothetical protein